VVAHIPHPRARLFDQIGGVGYTCLGLRRSRDTAPRNSGPAARRRGLPHCRPWRCQPFLITTRVVQLWATTVSTDCNPGIQMPQELQAGPVTLLQLLKGEREYVSPLFQRRYVWQQKELKQLWSDIDEILEGEESTHFLGALVLEVKSAGLAFQPDSTWIVDGQQRLTTLYTILVRVALEAEKAGADDLASSIFRQYLLNQDGQYKNRPKLLPTLLDYSQFNNLFTGVESITPRLQPGFGGETGPMQKAESIIRRDVRERCFIDGAFSEEQAKRLVSALVERLRFVQIILGDHIDPHQVFDSLNTKGVRLENKDLIRNLAFQKLAARPVEAEGLYRQKWVPLEEELRERFDDYFFPFALIHKPTATKSSLLSVLRDRWATWEPNHIIADLREFVPVFNALTAADPASRDGLTVSTTINSRVTRLYRMPAPSSVYPFVMRMVQEFRNGALSEDDTARNLLQIESFLVRRALAGYEPTGLHAVFKDLWHRTQGDSALMVEIIDQNPTVHFPDDVQFARDIAERPLYGRRLARYILAELERSLSGGDPYPETNFTIDHVMPQQLTSAWRDIVTEEEHSLLKDTWANLVPLSAPANAEKAQKPWAEARDYFLTETVFKTTKRLAHEYGQWDVSTIRDRASKIAGWAVSRWPKRAP
jgi:hypothetical protein